MSQRRFAFLAVARAAFAWRGRRSGTALTRLRGNVATASIVAAVAMSWAVAAWVARQDGALAISTTDFLCALALFATYAGACGLHVLRAVPPIRRAGFRVLLTTAVAGVSLGILETPALLGRLDYRRVWDGLTGNWRGPSSEYQLDFQRAFRRRPNVHIVGRPQGDIAGRFNLPLWSPRPLEFTYNARGFRGRTELVAADVALVGDSFVEGWYVSDGETCADRLAARIGRPVANLGQSGYGLAQELKVLEREALPLHPRFIVWFFYEGNDLYDDQVFENTMEYLAHAEGTPEEIARRMGYGRVHFREGSFTVNAFAALRRLLDPVVPNGVPYYGLFRDRARGPLRVYFYGDATGEFGAFEQSRLGKAETTLREGKDLCDRQGVRLLIAYVPVKFRVYGDYCELAASSACRSWRLWDLPRRVADFCRAEGLDFLDLTGPLRDGARAGHLLYVPQDSHWDREGHEWVAKLLEARYRALDQRLSAVSHPRLSLR